MKNNTNNSRIIAKRKILPGLDGIGKNCINKASLLETILRFLSGKLDKVITNYEYFERNLIRKIKYDIIKISKYKNNKKFNFYLICQEIVQSY